MTRAEQKPRWMLALRLVAGASVIAYALVLSLGARAGFPSSLVTASPFPFLADQPVGEDGYYLMTVAWNLGAGLGMTANFGDVVTGVQPLMTFLLGGIAALLQAFGADKFALARAVILLGGVNVLLIAGLVARAARDLTGKSGDGELAATFAFVSLCFSGYLFRTATYGLETGLYLLLFAIVLNMSLAPFTTRLALFIGTTTGLAGLARIDFGIVAGLAFAVMLAQRRIDLTRAALAGAVALALVAPWFFWVHKVSGDYMPSSGPAQTALVDLSSAPGRAEAMLAAVMQNLSPWLPMQGSVATGSLGLALLALLLAASRGQQSRALLAWRIAVASLPPIYFAFFWAGHFYARYTAPLLVLASIATACAMASLPLRARGPTLVCAALAIFALNAQSLWRAHHAGGVGDGNAVTAGYVAHEIPHEARVGAFQSGVTGYYNSNVINLDGKLNRAALTALREKRVEDYVDAAGIDYVVDWAGVIDGLMPGALSSGRWLRCPKPVHNLETICIMRRRS